MQYRFWDRAKDWVLLGLCLVVSLVVLVARNEPAVRSLRRAALMATSGIEATLAGVGRYLRALDENERLRGETVTLAVEAARSREAVAENDRLRRLLAFRDTLGTEMVAVRIVSKGLGDQQNLFTIDAGTDRGVRDGMPVVDERGILGRVVLTNSRYARVMPYLNTDFRVQATLLPGGAEGVVRWDGSAGDRLTLDFVPRTTRVTRGMPVVTSGGTGIFPAGFPIGTVVEAQARAGRNALDIVVRPASPLGEATHAVVLLVVPDTARLAIEAATVQ